MSSSEYRFGPLWVVKYCPSCHWCGRVIRKKKVCPVCAEPFPKRTKEYDELMNQKLRETAQKEGT